MSKQLTAKLGQLLIDAENNKIAPNAVEDLAYEMLYNEDLDGLQAAEISDAMFTVASLIEPPADDWQPTVVTFDSDGGCNPDAARQFVDKAADLLKSTTDLDVSITIGGLTLKAYDNAQLITDLFIAVDNYINDID